MAIDVKNDGVTRSLYPPLISVLSDDTVASLSAGERRAVLLDAVAKLIDSPVYFWAWGRGHPLRSGTTPLAMIDRGFTPESKAAFIEHGLSSELDSIFRRPIAEKLDVQACHLRREVIPDAVWYSSNIYQHWYEPNELDDWIFAVRYCAHDTWAMTMFLRRQAAGGFSAEHRDTVSGLLEHARWFHANASETVSHERFDGLTGRQRTILLLLLDGHSRRTIAERLFISENTVNEHVDGIYRQFQVRSFSGLVAVLLRGTSGERGEV